MVSKAVKRAAIIGGIILGMVFVIVGFLAATNPENYVHILIGMNPPPESQMSFLVQEMPFMVQMMWITGIILLLGGIVFIALAGSLGAQEVSAAFPGVSKARKEIIGIAVMIGAGIPLAAMGFRVIIGLWPPIYVVGPVTIISIPIGKIVYEWIVAEEISQPNPQ